MVSTSEQIAPESVAITILTSLANARARGEPWKAVAEAYLGPTASILTKVEEARLAMLGQEGESGTALAEMERKVLVILEDLTDTIWKKLRQPAQDPLLSLLSPGGVNFFLEWSIGEPTDRLEVLADLLSGGAHPDVDPAHVKEGVREIVAVLPRYRAMRERERARRAKLEVLEKVAETVAREGHVQHSKVRRRMREDGFDPDEVRAVFPDVPGAPQSRPFVG